MAEATETFARAGRIGTNVAMDVADMPGSAYIADEIADVSPSMDEMDDVPGPVQLAAARGSLEQTLHTSRDIDLGEPIKIAGNKARSSEAVYRIYAGDDSSFSLASSFDPNSAEQSPCDGQWLSPVSRYDARDSRQNPDRKISERARTREKREKKRDRAKTGWAGPHPRGQSHEERGRRVNLEGMPRQKGKARRSAPTPDTSAFRSVVGRRDGNAAVLA
ncbi:hypothetical protein L1887_57136 [Cichorium endivia]|nr:hypothetical protein L1887_57136 [Cichorium endivia]